MAVKTIHLTVFRQIVFQPQKFEVNNILHLVLISLVMLMTNKNKVYRAYLIVRKFM